MGAVVERPAALTARRRVRWPAIWIGAGALILLAVLQVVVVSPVVVPSESMAPTLHDGDRLLLQKLGEGRPGRGDIVAFREPGTGDLLVKRVAALGGDSLAVEDGVLVVNGEPVREPYVDQRTQDGVFFGPVEVPPGTVFVLGDNRAEASDSRVFGPVVTDDVRGRIVLRLWPDPGRIAGR